MNLYIATQNPHKVAEYQALLTNLSGVTIRGLPDGVPTSPEDGHSFESNAMEKAVYYSQHCDGWVLADDSGICVDALDGAPGVHSARFAGANRSDEALCRALLQKLDGVKEGAARAAQMVCVIALWHVEARMSVVTKGVLHGQVLTERRGRYGFGYDPLFFVPNLGCTVAELTAEQKNQVSHRAMAARHLMEAWTLKDTLR